MSAGGGPVSVAWDGAARAMLDKLDRQGVTWWAHNGLTTELPLMEKELGRSIPLDRMEDTMILHYLANAELCKAGPKDEDDEDRGAGYMDLWSMASLYTDLPQWKQCRGSRCSGPCHEHDYHGYNGIDALSVDLARDGLQRDIKDKNIPPALVNHMKRLMVMCQKMTDKGIAVDRQLVQSLEKEMEERKEKLFPSSWETAYGKKGQPLKNPVLVWDAPFNPRSPQDIKRYFAENGVHLDGTDKDAIRDALHDFDEDDTSEVKQWLERLHDYKAEGKGLKSWFDERYFHRDGLMHPRFIPTGTSMGRLASANPNFQNTPRIGFGANVRKVVVPRDSGLILVKADKSQLELRMCLWYAGILDALPKGEDAFSWLVKEGQGAFEKAAEIAGKVSKNPARDMAKSVSHGADYLEGFKVFYGKDLANPRTKKMIDYGALVVFRDWEYHGGVVGFTGVNLAQRFFGDASWENRKKALQIQEMYFARFGEIRRWHRRITADAERGYIQSASGRYLKLNGTPEEKAKMAAAFYGQGGGADDVQEAMLRYDDINEIPILQQHDELVFEFPIDTSDSELLDFFTLFSTESKFMPGFSCPVEVQKGPNWKDMTVVGKV